MREVSAFVAKPAQLQHYFRRFLPVVVDVETGGLNAHKHALLEIALVFLQVDSEGLRPDQVLNFFVEPHPDSEITKEAADFLDLNLHGQPRQVEQEVMLEIHQQVQQRVHLHACTRAILVGHNAAFDLAFMQAAMQRYRLQSPFHQFSTMDTVSLAAAAYGQTVLSKSCELAGIGWDNKQAHSALYDCQQTARLFCKIINGIRQLT